MTPPLTTIAIIDLSVAVLCPDCNAISNGIHECPRCTNRNLQALAPVLDRDTEEQGAHQ
jgi:hypothetical protein